MKKRGRKKKFYDVRFRLNDCVLGKCKYIKKKRKRRSTNGRVHRPAHESDVCPRCLKTFNVRGLGPHLAHCKVVRPGLNINIPAANALMQTKAHTKAATMKISEKKRTTGTSIQVMVLFERGWWHATVSRSCVLFDVNENIVSCYGPHLTVQYTMDGSIEDILKEDIPIRVRSLEDNLDVTVLYDRRWYKAKIPRCNVNIRGEDNMVTCQSCFDDVAVCYDVDSSVERVPCNEVTSRIRVVEAKNDNDIQNEDTESIIERILSSDSKVDMSAQHNIDDDSWFDFRVKSPTERSEQRLKSGKYVRYRSVQGTSSLSFPLGRSSSIFHHHHHHLARTEMRSRDDDALKLSIVAKDCDRFILNVTSAMLCEFSVSQIVNRIFELHGNHLPKELNSNRCTLCFARQVWNRDALLRDVLPANLGSSSALVVTLESILLKKQNPHDVNDDDNPTSAITTTAWRSYVRDRGIIF